MGTVPVRGDGKGKRGKYLLVGVPVREGKYLLVVVPVREGKPPGGGTRQGGKCLLFP